MPDARTVWRYREALAKAGMAKAGMAKAGMAKAGMVEALFTQFDGHPARQGHGARGGQILDASIVPVRCPHNTRDENKAIKNGEVPEDWADKPAKRSQKEADARRTRKHGKSQGN